MVFQEQDEFINGKKEFDPVQRVLPHDGSLYLDANDNLKEEPVHVKEEVVAKKVENDKIMSVSYTILHKVRATHTYTAEDTDELSFEIGDIIAVIPYIDEDDVVKKFNYCSKNIKIYSEKCCVFLITRELFYFRMRVGRWALKKRQAKKEYFQ